MEGSNVEFRVWDKVDDSEAPGGSTDKLVAIVGQLE